MIGTANRACGACSIVGGGQSNCTVAGTHTAVVGGQANCTVGTSNFSFIGGGLSNCICAATCAAIIGGTGNTANHAKAVIAGSSITSVSADMLHGNALFLTLGCLPTTDPGTNGVIWNDSGTLKVSIIQP